MANILRRTMQEKYEIYQEALRPPTQEEMDAFNAERKAEDDRTHDSQVAFYKALGYTDEEVSRKMRDMGYEGY